MARPDPQARRSPHRAPCPRALRFLLLGGALVVAFAAEARAMSLLSLERAKWSGHKRIVVQSDKSLPLGVERVLESGGGKKLIEAEISLTVRWSGKETSGKLQLSQLYLRVGSNRYPVVGAFSGSTFYEGARLVQTVSRKKGVATKQAKVVTNAVFRVPVGVLSGELSWSRGRLRTDIRTAGVKPAGASLSARILKVRRETSVAPRAASAGASETAQLRSRWGQLLMVTVQVTPRRAELWWTHGFTAVYDAGGWSPSAGEIGAKGWNADASHWARRAMRGTGFKPEEVQLVFAVPVWLDRFALWYGGEPVAHGVVPGGPGRAQAAAPVGTSSRQSATVAHRPGEEPQTTVTPPPTASVVNGEPGHTLQLVSPMPAQPSAADLFGSGEAPASERWKADEADAPGSSHVLLWILLLGLAAAGTWWVRYQRRHRSR